MIQGLSFGLVAAKATAPYSAGLQPAGGMTAWFDPSTGVVDGSGSLVSWTDRVGGYAATQSTSGQQPVVTPSAINGQTALWFDGSNDWLQADGLAFVGSGTAKVWTMATIVTAASFANYHMIAHWGSNTLANPYVHFISSTAGGVGLWRHNNAGVGQSTVVPQLSPNTPTVLVGTYDGTLMRLYKNGTLVQTTGTTNGVATMDRFHIGGILGTLSWHGYMGDFFVYDYVQSSTDRDQTTNYLKGKYGIA